jgi:Cys-tRNA(Pro) deacylase
MSAWPEPVERVSAALRAAGIEARIEQFEAGTPTARDAAKAVGCELSQIVKSVVLVCDGAYVIALVPGDRRADEQAVGTALRAEHVRVARPEEVVHATGFEPGGVAPFPQRAVTQTLIERTLLQHAQVWVGAGTDAHMVALAPGELQRLTKAVTFDLGPRG